MRLVTVYIDRTHGFVYNRVVLDREIRCTKREKRQAMEHDPSIAQVHIDVMDINANPPHFKRETYYAGKSLGKPLRVFIQINFHTNIFVLFF